MEGVTFNHLPLEIVEKILINVPTHCILFNKPWVCKLWTNIVLESEFWIRKLTENKVILTEDIKLVLQEFERHKQVACLYHACLYEEHDSLEVPLNNRYKRPRTGADGSAMSIYDNFEEMLMCSGILITQSISHAELLLRKKNVPVLPLLLKLLAARDATVAVEDIYTFCSFSPRSEYMQMLKGKPATICNLRGCVTSLEGLKKDNIHSLQLAIAVDEDNKAIDPGIPTTGDFKMMVQFKAGTNVSTLSKFRTGYLVFIVFGLESTHIEWMTHTIKNLCPRPNAQFGLILPNYYLNKNDTYKFLKKLLEENVQHPGLIICSSSTIDQHDVLEIMDFATEIWPEFIFDLYEKVEHLMNDRIFDVMLCEHHK